MGDKIHQIFLVFLLISAVVKLSHANNKRSLIFVADATNSMHDDLEQLRLASSKIINDLSNRGDLPIENYVLSIFRDREVDPIINTTNPDDIKNSLLGVHLGGGKGGNPDCPEHSMHGIKEALPYALPNSLIYVFTDDDANDYQIENEIKEELRKKQISISFLLTYGSCTREMNSSRPGFVVYERLAKETNGQVFSMDKKGVEDVLVAISDKLNPKYADLSRKDYASSGTNQEKMVVDGSMFKLVITATGKDPKLSALNPRNHSYEGKALSKNSRILIIENPIAGPWNIQSRAESPYSTQVGGLSEVTFDYGFSYGKPSQQDATLYQPMKGSKNILSVYISNASYVDKLSTAKFIQNERETQLIPLVKVKNNLYMSSPIDLPESSFKIGIEGTDKDKNNIRRMISTSLVAVEPSFDDLMKVRNSTSKYKTDLDHLCETSSQEDYDLVKLLIEWGYAPVIQNFLDAKITMDMMKNSLTEHFATQIFGNYPPGVIIKFMEKLKNWRNRQG